MTDVTKLKVAILSGTGRMGVHLAAAWADAGVDVTMCSRDIDKAREITDELNAGKGYSVGDIMVPPSDASKWKLVPGSAKDAVNADVIVLASPFHVMWKTLEPIADEIKGKNKIFMDLTNPWLNTSDKGNSQPIPEGEPQSSVLYHKKLLNDPTSSWAMAYRHVFWMLIHPTGPSKRCGPKGIEVIGEEKAVEVTNALIEAHGFIPVVREGGIDIAPMYELNFYGRVHKGEEGCPPGPGQDKDGLIGPFNASPLIGWDIMTEKMKRSCLKRYICG